MNIDPFSSAQLGFDAGTLVLQGWTDEGIERVFPKGLWYWDPRIAAFRTEAIHYPAVRSLIECKSIGTTIQLERWQKVLFARAELPELREEQSAAVAAWSNVERGVVIMPTGTGKTEVALRIMANSECSTLIVAPIRDLMYQWHRRILRSLDYDAGIIGDNTFNVKPVSVTTYDSASIHMPTLGNRFKLLIFDECHHLPGRMRKDAAQMSIAPMRLGLTATFERSDGKHADLEKLIGPVCYRLEIGAVRGGSLAEYDIFRVPVHLSDSERARYDRLSNEIQAYYYQRVQDDPCFNWETLCSESNADPEARRALRSFREKKSIEDRATEKLRVLEDLFRLHQGSPIVVFTGSNAMAREISRRFLVPCLLSHCGKQERLDYLEGLRDGKYPVLVANQILDEGVDLPMVKVAVIVGGMASSKQAKQRLGRILRKSGESRAVLYEIVTSDTNEVIRSRKRRSSDAYKGTRHRRL